MLAVIAGIDDLPELSFHTGDGELEGLRADIVEFIETTVDDAGAAGVIVAMSGGIDSTLTAYLACEALGSDRVTAMLLPCHLTDAVNTLDARSLAENLGVETVCVQIQPLLDMFEDTVAPAVDDGVDRVAIGNAVARLRMAAAYYAANRTNKLVCGTSNRTELLLGYFTKHGDGAADLRPLAGLYKTEVRALAGHVGVPSSIIEKTPTADLWAGQTDESELGAPYGLIDVILHALVDSDLGVSGTATELGIDEAIVGQYANRLVENRHKRLPAPTPDGTRDVREELFFELESRF